MRKYDVRLNLSSGCLVVMAAPVLLSAASPLRQPADPGFPLRSGLCHSIAGFIAGPLNSQIPTFAAIEGQSHVVIARYEAIRNKELKGLLRTSQ